MLKYLYIPESEDLDDHINFAVENGFNQIIHGNSDIIEELVVDKGTLQEINIPEYRELNTDFLVFKENEEFSLKLIDEFIIDGKYTIGNVSLYRVDDVDLNKKDFVLSKDLIRISNFIYEFNLCIEKYGEYIIQILHKDNDGTEKVLVEERIIIYKEYQEEEKDEKFFFAG
jgi:hypothetical protein